MTVIALERMNVPTWLLFLTAAVFVFVAILLDWFLETHRRRVALGLLTVVYLGIAAWASLSSRNPLVIYYGAIALNGQDITLVRPIASSRRQLLMFIDPDLPLFGLVGISARNKGGESLEADSAYVRFSAPMTMWQANSGSWELSPDRSVEGWTTFQYPYGRNSIGSGRPLDIPYFLGTPVPMKAMKARVIVVYGLKEARAEFTIRP